MAGDADGKPLLCDTMPIGAQIRGDLQRRRAMSVIQKECEALGTFYSASILVRSLRSFQSLRLPALSNPALQDSLFCACCTFYAAAFDRFSRKGICFDPSARKAEGYDRDVHKMLMSFRNKMMAHRDSNIHKSKLVTASIIVKHESGRTEDVGYPILTTSTTVAPRDADLIQRIETHILAVTQFMASSAHGKLIEWRAEAGAASFGNVEGQTFSVDIADLEEPVEDERMPGLRKITIAAPESLFHNDPPVGADQYDLFLHLVATLKGIRIDAPENKPTLQYEA